MVQEDSQQPGGAPNEQQPQDQSVNGDRPQRELEPNKLFLRNIPFKTTEEEVKEFFAGYGEITDVRLILVRKMIRPVRFAFITFVNEDNANKARDELDGKEFKGRPVSISTAQVERPKEEREKDREARMKNRRFDGNRRAPGGRLSFRLRRSSGPPENGVESKDSLFVAGLAPEIQDEELKELFSKYNVVKATVVLRYLPWFVVAKIEQRGEKRHSRGYGFVTLDTTENQEKAMNELDGTEYKGRKLIVKKALDKPEEAGRSEEKNADVTEERAAVETTA